MSFDIWLTMLLASILISVSPGAGAVVSMNYGLIYLLLLYIYKSKNILSIYR